MKRKIWKILIIGVLIFIISNIYMSAKNKVMAMSDPTEVPPQFWISGNKDVGEEEIVMKGGQILGLVRIFGTIASVITLAIIGIKFMYGGVEEKAAYKQTLIPWVVGAFMLFTMTTIPSIVFNIIGEEHMEEDLTTSRWNKIITVYCIRGNEMEEDPMGNYYCKISTCDCGDTMADRNDENYKYKCGTCKKRLTKISDYYWCYSCKKKFE